MTAIAHSGAGVLLRAGTLTAAGVREATARALTDAPLRAAAKRVATDLARYRAADLFPAFVERACAGRRAPREESDQLSVFSSRPSAPHPSAHSPDPEPRPRSGPFASRCSPRRAAAARSVNARSPIPEA